MRLKESNPPTLIIKAISNTDRTYGFQRAGHRMSEIAGSRRDKSDKYMSGLDEAHSSLSSGNAVCRLADAAGSILNVPRWLAVSFV